MRLNYEALAEGRTGPDVLREILDETVSPESGVRNQGSRVRGLGS
jgi:hypothetical protein